MLNIGNNFTNFSGNENLFTALSRISEEKNDSELGDVKRNQDTVDLVDNNENLAVDKKKWTILLYSAADNNLEEDLTKDVIEMEEAGSNRNMNLLVQLDRGEKPSEMSDGWAGCKRFYLNKDNDSSKINSPSLQDMGQVNMADPEVLADFVKWGIKNYPAEHYMLIISDHGYGWEGAIEDESHKGWMSVPDINNALMMAQKETGEKIAILGFDACLMATTEVIDEFKNSADFVIASQDIEGVEGWPYANIFTGELTKQFQKALNTKFTLSPELVAKGIVNHSENNPSIVTLSALDTSKATELAKATDSFAKAILETDMPLYEIKNVAKKTKEFEGFKDHGDFAKKIIDSPKITDEKIKKAAEAMLKALDEIVIAEQHSEEHSNATGLNIEVSRKAGSGIGDFGYYHDLAFAKETSWDEAMLKVYGKGKTKAVAGEIPKRPFGAGHREA